METDEKGNPLTYWGGLEETMENRIKGINVDTGFKIERSYSEEEVIAFGEFIFKNSLLTHIKGVKSLFEQFKNK